jgi:hypothetical protein
LDGTILDAIVQHGAVLVTLMGDSGLKYLGTDVYRTDRSS